MTGKPENGRRYPVGPPDPSRTYAGETPRYRPDVVAKICRRVRRGTPIEHACALERVARSTLYAWAKIDPDVLTELEYARARAAEVQRRKFINLRDSDAKTTTAQLAYMARRWPDVYGEKTTVEVQAQNAPLMIKASITDAERAALRERATRKLAARNADTEEGE